MSSHSLYQRRKRPGEAFLLSAIYGAASLSVFLLVGIIGYLFWKGFRVFSIRFFTSVTNSLKGTMGIAGNLVNTLYIVVMTLLIAIPVGVGAAIYMSEYAKQGRLTQIFSFATELLAGIPSVLFGLFGMVFFGGVMGLGYSLLNGALTMTLMLLPLIVRNTQEALRNVPDSYRNGAIGMGADKWHMIRTVLLPSAAPGILTGVILAVGRIVGESTALIFTAGSARMLPRLGREIGENIVRLWEKVWDSGGTLTVELYLQMQNGEYELAFGIGCVLVILVLLINMLLKLAVRGFRKA